jgi:ABC-type oligopeptide transport system substrate-binding subunit
MFGGLGWIADYPDPENFLDVLFYSKSTNNQTGYVNQDVDRLLEKARIEPDQAARFAIYHDVEKRILADAPWVPLWHGKSGYVLLKPFVKDFFLFPLIIPQLRYVYLTER